MTKPSSAQSSSFVSSLRFLATLLLLLCSLSSSSAKQSKNECKDDPSIYDVCIIGGGAAGSYSATYLKDRGYDVLLFERQGELGGQCDTIRFPGGWNEAGVLQYFDTATANAFRVALNMAGLGDWDIDAKALVTRFAGAENVIPWVYTGIAQSGEDLKNGPFFLPQLPNPPPTLQDSINFGRFIALMNGELSWISTMNNVPNPVPASLRVPIGQWLINNGFADASFTGLVANIFVITVYYVGNGDFYTTSALDALAGATLLTIFAQQPGATGLSSGGLSFSVKNGCLTMYEGMLRYLDDDVMLNAAITSVVRAPQPKSNKPTTISGTQNGTAFVKRCKELIVAIPPEINNLSFMSLKPKETALFSQVSHRFYVTGLADVSGGLANTSAAQNTGFILANVDTQSPGAMPQLPAFQLLYRLFSSGPAVHLSQWLNNPTPAQRQALVVDALARLSTDPTNTIKSTNIRSWQHQFMPYFSASALGNAQAPQNQLDQMQGEYNTYYLGNIRHPWSHGIWNYCKRLIDRNFPVKHGNQHQDASSDIGSDTNSSGVGVGVGVGAALAGAAVFGVILHRRRRRSLTTDSTAVASSSSSDVESLGRVQSLYGVTLDASPQPEGADQ